MPSIARPPEMMSSVVTILASRAGLRYVTPVTIVPRRTRLVRAASAPSERVGLQHRCLFRADAADLVEVVHHRDDVEAGRLGRLDEAHEVLEELVVRHAREGEEGHVVAEEGSGQGSRSLYWVSPRA